MTEEKADQIIRCVKECWWRVLLVITVPMLLIASLLQGWPVALTVEDGLAAWVQAIGSVAAVGSGVLLLRHQIKHRKALDTENEKLRRIRLIKNLKTEIKVNWTMLEDSWGSVINAAVKEPAGVKLIMNLKGWAFPVYDANAGDLGLIESEEVRNTFILVYAAARGFLLTMEINNELIFRCERATRENQQARVFAPALIETAEANEINAIKSFNDYGPHVRKRYGELKLLVEQVLKVNAI